MIPIEIRKFIKGFPYGFLGTCDRDGKSNISIKGIISVDSRKIYFCDLFQAKTSKNLQLNPKLSFFVIDWNSFVGYQLKGVATMEREGEVFKKHIDIWEKKRSDFIISRMLENLKGDKITRRHDLYLLKPEYLIVMDVEEIYDLVEPIKVLVKTHLDKMKS
ncbi:MAG TPA: pyridoxamine 5'-phosphate oxidase family protein [Candidatus Omnitrophica bacterium]|nr:pyridoxamine 5'-phosphate oxidase family protein [Candidatus Omnitrophota bacterium]